MNTSSAGVSYGLRFTGVVLSLAFLSACVLYVALAGRSGGRGGDLFGDPFGQPRLATATADTMDAGGAGGAVPQADDDARAGDPDASLADEPRAPVVASAETPTPDVTQVRETPVPPPHDARETARRASAARQWEQALRVYDRLVRERPNDRALALERALVLSWSGAHAEAADALISAGPRPENEPELVLELANNLYWAGRFEEADDALEPLVRLRSGDAELDALRSRIRAGARPSIATAKLWLDRRDTPLERLLLARALAGGGRDAESLTHYRRALDHRAAGDSLALELAAAAEAADSLATAAFALEAYLAGAAHDDAIRLRLARVLHAAGSLDAARGEYGRLLRGPHTSEARFELARLEAWDGNHDRARPALEELLREDPQRADVLNLLADLARWDGDWPRAESYYRTLLAVDPHHPGAAEALVETERALAAGSTAPPRSPVWTASVDGFSDTEGFRWLGSRAARSWYAGALRFDLGVQQEVWDAVQPPGPWEIGPGYGIEVAGETPLSRSSSLRLAVGARKYGSGFDFASWSVDLAHGDVLGAAVEVGYRREPSFRRAATAAALQAQAASDIGRLTAGRSFGAWHAWSQLEVERLSSGLGETVRGSGTAALRRELGDGWAAYGTVGALAADGASPVLAGWGPLYWAPASFASVAAGGAYRADISPFWTLELKLAPGFAWIEERDGSATRYATDRAATIASGFDASYVNGSWRASLGGELSAAHRGYRASALRVGLHYSPTRP